MKLQQGDRPKAGPLKGKVSELLVTVAIAADTGAAGDGDFARAAQKAATFLQEHFRFWELLLLVSMQEVERAPNLIAELCAANNVRLLVTRPGIDRHNQFTVMAAESLGDFVILASLEEFEEIDLGEIWKRGEESGSSVVLRRPSVSGLKRIGAACLSFFTGYRIDPALLSSCGHFRARLTSVQELSDKDLVLRFAQFDGALETLVTNSAPGAKNWRRRSFGRTLSVAADLIAFGAPRLLKMLALASLITLVGAFSYLVYALILWGAQVELAEGWLTTSLAIGLSTCFLAAAFGCIALGLAKVLELQQGRAGGQIVREVDASNLFASVGLLNVERDL